MASPPQGEYEKAARAFLCTRRTRIDPIPSEIATLLRAWLQQCPTLVSSNALSTALPYNEDFHRLGGSLLAWGLTRPWRDGIERQQIVEQWYDVLDEPNLFSNTLALNMAYATKIMRSMLPYLPFSSMALADVWLNRAMNKNNNSGSSNRSLLWQIDMHSPDVRQDVMNAWCDLYEIAEERSKSGPSKFPDWLACVKVALQNIGYNRIDVLLMLLANESLPGTAKLLVASSLDSEIWFNPDVSRVLLPITASAVPLPSMRLYYMPWTLESNGDGLTREQRSDLHRRVCEMYCHELGPLFSLVTLNWLSKEHVSEAAHQHMLLSKESLPVVGLLDQENSFGW